MKYKYQIIAYFKNGSQGCFKTKHKKYLRKTVEYILYNFDNIERLTINKI